VRVGQEVHVRLLDPLEAADRRAVEYELVVERLLELVHRNRHVLDGPVRLRELQSHERDVVAPAALDDLLPVHRGPLFVSPFSKAPVYRRGRTAAARPGGTAGPRGT